MDSDSGHLDLGESAGMSEEERDEYVTDQNSHIQNEVRSLGKEVADLEKDNDSIPDMSPGELPDKLPAPSRQSATDSSDDKAHKMSSVSDQAPVPSDDAKGNDDGHPDVRETAEDMTGVSVEDPAEEAVKLQIEAEETAKIAAADKAEASKLAKTEAAAEQSVTESKTKSTDPNVLTEPPKPLPEAPRPVTKPLSEELKEAKSTPMPAVEMTPKIPSGKYAMQTTSAVQEAAKVKEQHERDVAISKNAGKVVHVMASTIAKQLDASYGDSILTTDGPVDKYTPPTGAGFASSDYCTSYANRIDNEKPKWTSNYCMPQKGDFEDIMHNVDGVVCACGGNKVANVPASITNPGMQESVYARVQVTEDRMRSFAHRLSASVDPKEPRPAYGFTWEIRLTDADATINNHDVDPRLMQSVFITFNRIFEFMDNTNTGLHQDTTKLQDLESGSIWPGYRCDEGQMSNRKKPNGNCVVQDFFLDNFELADVAVDKKKLSITFQSDVQGTSPWCDKSKSACAQEPINKPVIRFELVPESNSFTDAKMSVFIQDFPYKIQNSSLALGASIFAETIGSEIESNDVLAVATPGDEVSCVAGNGAELPSTCPRMKMSDDVRLSWSKTVVNTETGKKHKVVVPQPTRVKSGVSSSAGLRLIHKTALFSFKHQSARTLQWDTQLRATAAPLPLGLKSSAPHSWQQSTLMTAMLVVVSTLFAQNMR